MKDFDTIGRYETIDLLGRGGMGSVYLARDPVIDRQLAIKVLDSAFDAAARERFAREARAAGRLHHPNIVTIFDVGEHRGLPFIAMEYVPGQTLAALVRQSTLALAEKLRLLEDACAGLSFAHRAGIVHLDIKPANLIRHESGVLKILDFGIARVATDATHTRQIAGTLQYMAPEQVLGHAVDRRSDVFALGCVLYEVLAGEPAFKGSVSDLLSRVTNPRSPASLAEAVPGLHPELVRMAQRAMAHDPHDRYDDLEVLRQELGALRRQLADPIAEFTTPLSAPTESARTTVLSPPGTTAGSRHPRRVWAAAALAVAIVAVVAIWMFRPAGEDALAGRAGNAIGISQPPVVSRSLPPTIEAPRVERAEAGSARTPRNDDVAPRERQLRQPIPKPDAKPTEPRGAEPVTRLEPPAAPADSRPVPPPTPVPSPPPENIVTEPSAREASSTPPPATPNVEASIAEVLKAYEAAYDARDAAALRRVAPGLSAQQVEAISRTFADASSYDVDLKIVAINVSGSTATARCLVAHSMVPRIGSASRSSPRETVFHLRQTSNGWVIDRIDR